jgi:hypothetical protein
MTTAPISCIRVSSTSKKKNTEAECSNVPTTHGLPSLPSEYTTCPAFVAPSLTATRPQPIWLGGTGGQTDGILTSSPRLDRNSIFLTSRQSLEAQEPTAAFVSRL